MGKKTREYMKACNLGTDIKTGLIMQLTSYESRLQAECKGTPLSRDWSGLDTDVDPEELLMNNTFVNLKDKAESAKTITDADQKKPDVCVITSRRPSWSDAVA